MDYQSTGSNKEKLLRAALECRAYALENDLLSSLDTADHLAFHQAIIEIEQNRISPEERSLAHEHLPQFHIPTTSVTEDFPVPKHVADLIETASSLLYNDKCPVIDTIHPPKVRPKSLKMQPPLLLSGPEEDCVELQRVHNAIYRKAQERVRQLRSTDDIDSLPQSTLEFANGLDESIRMKIVNVSQESVQFLKAFVNSSQTPKRGAELTECRERLTSVKIPKRSHMALPLRPTILQPASLSNNDAFLFSEASDLSSHASDALMEAEQALGMQDEGTILSAETALDLSTINIELFEEEPDTMEHVFSSHIPPKYAEPEEDELPMQVNSKSFAPREASPLSIPYGSTEDDVVEPSTRGRSVEEGLAEPDILVDSQTIENDTSLGYEQQTVEQLLGLGISEELVAQAKMPVPALTAKTNLMQENHVMNSGTLFHWIKENNMKVFDVEEWQAHDQGNHLRHIDLDRLIEATGEDWLDFPEEMLTVDEELVKTAASIVDKVLSQTDCQGIQPNEFQLTATRAELVLRALPPDAFEQSPLKEDGSWSSLMNQWKRKKQKTGDPKPTQKPNPNSSAAPSVRGPSKFTAPELLLGVNAFVNPPSSQPEEALDRRGCQPDQNDEVSNAAEAEEAPLAPCPDIDPCVALPKVVLSTALPRLVRSTLVGMLPALTFVERDYQQGDGIGIDSNARNVEPDIVHSPRSGIVFMTMVGLRQSGPGGPKAITPFQKRVAEISTRYQELLVVIYRHNKIGINADLPELSPSDAMAFAELQGFARHLAPARRVSVLYASGGERGAAWLAVRRLCLAKPVQKHEECLTIAATPGEMSLRRLGLNVYNAQIVLGSLRREPL